MKISCTFIDKLQTRTPEPCIVRMDNPGMERSCSAILHDLTLAKKLRDTISNDKISTIRNHVDFPAAAVLRQNLIHKLHAVQNDGLLIFDMRHNIDSGKAKTVREFHKIRVCCLPRKLRRQVYILCGIRRSRAKADKKPVKNLLVMYKLL